MAQHRAVLDRLNQPPEYLGPGDCARTMAETIAFEERRVARLGLRAG